MTLQEMHESVCAKHEREGRPIPRMWLFRQLSGGWKARWEGAVSGIGLGDSAQAAIDAAFKLAMEDR